MFKITDFKSGSCIPIKPGEEDMVISPAHYLAYPLEVIDIIQLVLTSCKDITPFEAYCFGNELKYRLRAGFKGTVQEQIDKATRYLEFRKNKQVDIEGVTIHEATKDDKEPINRSYYKRLGKKAFLASQDWETACPFKHEKDAEKRNLFHLGWFMEYYKQAEDTKNINFKWLAVHFNGAVLGCKNKPEFMNGLWYKGGTTFPLAYNIPWAKPDQLWERGLNYTQRDIDIKTWKGHWWRLVEDHNIDPRCEK